ncbi:NAD(P)/FAD-dependent oxidoreductase [Belnapia sp. T6]|uniref:Thioredoxin reductase n=1 Tax=Belnapia mucosa TaxID=2804532 RepID=A0ABS1V3P6_9PROT|nr:NAD(P)/FAD-dependent oxidoreductase [Belnapia mucosa]MBL6456317.1 NAD(P)/FAD-dependent oxidoreductase [Belnapia mucosa]
MYDVAIVGGGPAGLNAALVLGRCRRRVLLCDAGNPRNAASRGVNGFLSRDGIPPGELRRIGRQELGHYETVELRDADVADAECLGQPETPFRLTLAGGERVGARKLILATGLVEELPQIEGMETLWGQSVFDCPYCDGWEERDRPMAVYGRGERGMRFALEMLSWSRDLVLLTDGPAELSAEDRDCLVRNGVSIREEQVARLEGGDGRLDRIRFHDGSALERSALFLAGGIRKLHALVTRLGLELTSRGTVRTGTCEATNVPGLYVAGDASRRVQFAVVAAAEGAMAAFAVHDELLTEDRL